MVERIVQVISGSLGCLVWPKQLHDLLPVEAVTAGEGEQLYQGGRLPEPPCLFRDGSRTYANPKATEQPDAHRLGPLARRHPRSCYAFKASRRAHSRASPFMAELPYYLSHLLSYRIRVQDNESPIAWQIGTRCIGANRQKREPTSGLEPLTYSLRVIHQMLPVVAEGCKSRISREVTLPWLAVRCTVLRSRWCQSGVKMSWITSPPVPLQTRCVRR